MSYNATLTVGGDVISVFDISEIIIREEFKKARLFEIRVLNEARASWTLDETVVIDYGFASPKRLRGRLEGIDKRGALAILTGRDVSYETLDRPVDKEYTDTEVVAIMKDLIDTYAAGVLTYANAGASASTIGSIYPRRISMLDAFNKLIPYAESVDGDDFIWYLDHDKDLHTFAEGDVDNGRELEWMIEIFDYRRIRDSWRAYEKVTVYGGLDSDGNATSGSAGAGAREKIVIDEFLNTNLACTQRAVTELKKTSARDVYALTCILASDGPTLGERVFVTLDPEEIEMAFIVYAVEDHLYSGVTVVEVGESVAGLTDTMIDEHTLDQYMQQIKPGQAAEVAIYTVVGTSGTDALAGADQVISEMTKTITCSAGDLLIISFDGTFNNKTTDPRTEAEINIEVDGVEIGNRLWVANTAGAFSHATKWGTTITRLYRIPSGGDYTIEVHAYNIGDSPTYVSNYRTMSIQHIKSLAVVAPSTAGVDIYTLVGTSGTHSVVQGDGEVTVSEMTKNLVCVAGDKVIVSFDSTIMFPTDGNLEGANFWLEMDGVQVGEKVFMVTDLGGNKRWSQGLTRDYSIPADGTYTVAIKTQVNVSGTPETWRYYLNNRTLTIQHIKSLVVAGEAESIEGDYTTWTHVWTRDYGVGVNVNGLHVSNTGTVFSTDSTAVIEKGYVRTVGGAETNRTDYVFGWLFHPRWHPASVLNQYVVGQNMAPADSTVDVWKDGVLIWSRYTGDDTVEAFWPEVVGMSPNGKYLAVAAISSDSFDTQLVLLYEGS